MKINELKELLKDKRVLNEINKHLWIESQKAGYNIGFERAMDEWLRLYSEAWMKYNMPEKYKSAKKKQEAAKAKKTKKTARKKASQTAQKTKKKSSSLVKKTAKKKTVNKKSPSKARKK